MPRKNPKGRRYSESQKKRILETAAKERLTGAQVKKRFGISTLTFYRWRGPVRGKRAARVGSAAGKAAVNVKKARLAVRAELQKMMPRIIQEEISAYLKMALR
jgi:transposase-like protein